MNNIAKNRLLTALVILLLLANAASLATYWCVELDSVFRDHGCNTFVREVTAVVTRVHLSLLLSPWVFQCHDTVRHVELEVAARRWIHNDHNRHSLCVLVRDQSWTLIWVTCIQLDQVSSLSDLALHLILQLVAFSGSASPKHALVRSTCHMLLIIYFQQLYYKSWYFK